jgi:hypothetical protein
MENIIKRINKLKSDKSCYNSYIKCFTSNKKAEELFQKSKSFEELKSHIKRVSR